MAIQIRSNQIAASNIITSLIANSAVTNAKLANSSVSLGGVSVALGASDATPAFDLSDATSYPTSSLVGTITNAQLAGSIANAKLANSSVSLGGVSIALGATDATPAFDLQDATGYPTSSLTGTITNAQLAGSIANAKLANSSVAFGGVTLSLGGSDATPAFDLTDATNYPTSSLSGTITNAQLAGSIAFDKLADSANIARLDQSETVGAVWGFGSNLPTASANPSADNQLARKAYVDSVAQGLDIKDSVKAATTANITLSGTQTIDGVGILADDRVLVKNQSTGSQNGIYICAAGAWSRASDFANGADEAGAFTFIEQGSTQADTGWVCTNNKGSGVVGTNALVFSQFSGAGTYTAGDGMDLSGSVFSVDLAANKGLEILSTELAIKVNAGTAMQVDSNGVGINLGQGVEVNSSALRVKLDGSSLARSSNGVKVADNGVGLQQAGFRFYRETLDGDGSGTTFDLARALNSNFTDAVMVFRNGIFMKLSGSPADVDEFSVSATGGGGGVGRLTIGAAPSADDKLYIIYPA